MHTYWYVSTDKLEALGASDAGLLGRLRTTLKLGVPGAGLEVGLDSTPTRSLDRAVDRVEKRLRRGGAIGDIADFADGPPPAVYFTSHGPASRAVIEGMFWTAAVNNDVAVLLVGSSSNAIAAGRDKSSFRPTVDPVGAVRRLLQAKAVAGLLQAKTVAGDIGGDPPLEEAWLKVFYYGRGVVGGDIDALPMATSISEYTGRCRFERACRVGQIDVNWLILGTPIYVAQIK